MEVRPRGDRSLAEQLFDLGVEFPCGGESACGGCKILVVEGDVPIVPMMRDALSEEELAAGWRLACCAEASGPVVFEVEQWSIRILTDEARVEHEPRPGFGVAIDLGTTTLVAQLVDLESGEVLSNESGLNPQARFGADVMTRIQYDLREPGALTALIRSTLGDMTSRLAAGRRLEEVLVAGNTVMHHLFCGLSVEPLAAVPFRSPWLECRRFAASELGWPVEVAGSVEALPCLGGFVGADILAGLIATGFTRSDGVHALMDLGTNGEIAVGNGRRIVCSSTAAGPAFEGGKISCGMRAGAGAVDRVHLGDNGFSCHIIGGSAPRGICGSGLVDAAACGLAAGSILPNGRLAGGARILPLTASVDLTQADFRELQLAKGAMASGLSILSAKFDSKPEKVSLAGAFGNYIHVPSARAIGLLPKDLPVEPVGNTALRGVRMLLVAPSRRASAVSRITAITEHVELASEPGFEDQFAGAMSFAPYRLL